MNVGEFVLRITEEEREREFVLMRQGIRERARYIERGSVFELV